MHIDRYLVDTAQFYANMENTILMLKKILKIGVNS